MIKCILNDIDTTVKRIESGRIDSRQQVELAVLTLRVIKSYLQPWSRTLADLAVAQTVAGEIK
jgi:hypothetical protein